MAAKSEQPPRPAAHEFSDADKSRARQWFKKAADCRERREYDYAIECYITGLGFWPEAVTEGHMPLSSLALQRAQAGGKKPGMMEKMQKPTSGKDAKQAMLNAEHLSAKDPANGGYLDAVMKNAVKAGYFETLKWIAPRVMDSLRRDAKPDLARFRLYRTCLVEAAEAANAAGTVADAAWFYEHALTSVEFLAARNPTDAALRDEQRDLSGRLTIAKGKYAEASTFRDSLQDADKQKLLHDADRVQQGEQTLEDVIAAARHEYEQDRANGNKINTLVDLLLRRERPEEEAQALAVLDEAYESSRNYSYKVRADDVRLRQLRRTSKALADQARVSGDDGDRQQARLAAGELVEAEIAIYSERVQKYPTDLRSKFRLGEALFKARRFDEAIPALQAARGDPRARTRAELLIGRAFFEKGNHGQAAEVLKEALEGHEIQTDELAKELLYRLARAYEAAGNVAEARSAFNRLLRLDYNYASGDARQRLESMKES
ncbi:MAG: tetratricopeptide repeat protein [Phycisphaerae bacterium]|nr:tetratricopeptide repeat protein [Phycisphaerae bacterium]MCZ2401257.1 tetratricopeptide repeat protein [Phycisphaerae bacterium]NUQ49926.1 tetratricopeptide repeat protein [Phycisphaerae bacterium]